MSITKEVWNNGLNGSNGLFEMCVTISADNRDDADAYMNKHYVGVYKGVFGIIYNKTFIKPHLIRDGKYSFKTIHKQQ